MFSIAKLAEYRPKCRFSRLGRYFYVTASYLSGDLYRPRGRFSCLGRYYPLKCHFSSFSGYPDLRQSAELPTKPPIFAF